MWDRLTATGAGTLPFDVVVVGGGITGAGIARDAARRGLRVALCEMNDLAYGTSSRSTKLVHGGLRYLETGEVGLVFESVSERRVLTRMAPHLVRPLGFYLPVFRGARRGLAIVDFGLWVYDALSLFRSPKIHQRVPAERLANEEPALRTDGIEGAALYYDCATDDARLTVETAVDATRAGAVVATWTRVDGFLRDAGGHVDGVNVRCMLTGRTAEVRARVVVNATGPWTDATRSLGDGRPSRLLRPTKGVHIVVDAAKLPLHHAVLCTHPDDGRVMFAIPWGDRTYVGTTDTDYQGDPADVAATREDVEYLLAACASYFPKHPLERGDVIATWAGLRPLLAPPDAGVDESEVSREHRIVVGDDGLVTIAGGKLTTFRLMAAEVVDEAERRLGIKSPTRRAKDALSRAPLPGAVGIGEDGAFEPLVDRVLDSARGTLSRAVAAHLVDVYGGLATRLAEACAADPSLAEPLVPGRSEILAQIDWAVQEELAATVADVMIRRTQLFFRDLDQGLGAVPKVAARLGALLGWDDATRESSIEAYRAEVERSRRFRRETGAASVAASA